MATLIPEITITDFKKLKVHELRRLKTCEVFADGMYLFTFVNAQTGYIRAHAEELGVLGNGVRGESLEDILNSVPV